MSEQLIPTPSTFGENGNFLLERELGQGGMGGVYLGRDKMLDRPVAVKVMLKELGSDAEFVEKFKREAQSAAKLIHPNIAQVYSYGIADGMPYIAMELVAGGSLDQIMRNSPGKTDIPRVMKIGEQVAQALRCAADQGLVHGDIKPENILLDANGNAKIVDFGLAAMQKDTDEIWGTPYYIAPEKVKREVVDYRADMYNLGGTLYHALTGVAPFEGEDANAVVKKRFEGAPKKPSEIRPELSPQIDNLVMKMLALDKVERYPSFEALIEAFKMVMTSGLDSTQKVTTTPTTTAKKTTIKSARRKITPKATPSGAIPKRLAEESEEEEDKGVGKKVTLVIVSVVIIIGVIIGGLKYYQKADKASRAAEKQSTITSKIALARESILETKRIAEKFSEDFCAFAGGAETECEKSTSELAKLMPEYAAILKPNNSTNAPVQKVEGLAEPPAIVYDMQELWKKVYACSAAASNVSNRLAGVIADCDKSKEIMGKDELAMNKLGEISRRVVETLEAVKVSKDVENVRKDIGVIKSKGSKAVKQTIERLRVEKLEADRKAKREAELAAIAERRKAAEDAKKVLVESEQAKAKAKFEQIVALGSFNVLDWKGAKRQLESLKRDLKTPEGELAVDAELNKIEAMQSVQEIIKRNLKNFEFKRAKLKKCKVIEVNDKDIILIKPDSKDKVRTTWIKLYKECHANLNELLISYIEEGRKNGNPKLTLKQWADAMCGAALTMKLVCSNANGAAERSEAIAKAVAKQYPDLLKKLRAMFPDIEFDDVPAEE